MMIALGLDDIDKAIMDMARLQQDAAIEAPAKPGVGMTVTRKPADYSEAAWEEVTQAQQ